MSAGVRQTELYLSSRCEDFFGAEITEKILEDFNGQNPDMQVRLFHSPNKKIKEPDILVFDEVELGAAAAAGLVPLRIFSDSETYPDREQLAIPLVSFMDLLFYNIELLQSAGFDRPPKTRDEFLAYAKAVQENTGGAAGSAVCLNSQDKRALSRDFFSWMFAAGNVFFTSDHDSGPVIDNRAFIADISFFGRLCREGLLADFDITGERQLEDFAQGKIAMMIASTRAIPALREVMGGDAFGITAVPASGSGAQYSVCLDSIYAGISAKTKHPDKAWRFLEFLIGQSPLLCEELKAVPGIVSELITGKYIKDDPFYSKAHDIFETSVVVHGFSGIAGSEEFENIFREEIMLYFETQNMERPRTERETAAAIQQRWDEFYNKAGEQQ